MLRLWPTAIMAHITQIMTYAVSIFLDPRGGSLSLTHVVVLVDFLFHSLQFSSKLPETWRAYVKIPRTDSNDLRF